MATTFGKYLESPLGPRDAGLPMDLDDFEAADFEEGYRYEVINGILVVTPWPLEEERSMNDELGYWLRTYRESHPRGPALDDTLPEQTVRTKKSQRRCDRAIWAVSESCREPVVLSRSGRAHDHRRVPFGPTGRPAP